MNRIIKVLGYQFYIKEILVVFFAYLMMENIFSWLVLPNSVIILAFEKIVSIIIFLYVLYNFTNFKRNEQIYIALFVFVMMRLVFESMFKFGSIFQQFTLFTVLFPVIYTVFIKAMCRSLELDLLEFIAKFYLVVYVLVMLIYGRGFGFGLESVDMIDYGPFSGDSRIIHARSIFTMIIPFLWYFSRFWQTHKLKHLLIFAFCFVVILIHQHRSVWASAIVALLLFVIISFRNKHLSISKTLNLLIVSLFTVAIAWIALANLSPQFANLLGDRFSEILDPTREGGTGHFREEQREVYFKLFLQRPVFGWTFDGFEMPNPLVNWWPPKSGQHFHEGYMEMLFYHGVVGILLKYWFLIYLSVKAFSKKLNREAVILIAFSISGLVFSFSYVLPLIFWGHVGLCLYYLEKKDDDADADEYTDYEEIEPEETTALTHQHLNYR